MQYPGAILGGLPVEAFLSEHWQKQPLLIRQAVPGFVSPLTPDELAGLACEPDVESRLVIESAGATPWEVRDGPFDEAAFRTLPPTHWTLLVQAVDQWVPEMSELLAAFRFIPNWRIDDVMVSFAPEGGSVGPHCDSYDVFLLQGKGRRRWQIGPRCGHATPLLPHDRLRLLRQFKAEQEWVLEPGDMLYVPPGLAHHGVALDECMTFSIGFRAPSIADILTGYIDTVTATLNEDDRYADPDLAAQANPSEISAAALARLRTAILARIDNPALLGEWFGRAMTEPKYEVSVQPPERPVEGTELRDRLGGGAVLHRNEGSRFAFVEAATAGTPTLLLFVDGTTHPCPGRVADLARLLCDRPLFQGALLTPYLRIKACTDLLARLVNAGSLHLS